MSGDGPDGGLVRSVSRLPPGGHAVGPRALWRLARGGATADALAGAVDALATRLGGGRVRLFDSGRAGLVVALRELAAQRGRDELVVPAYTCFSVPAAAVAAGLRVRLVDVDDRGRLDPKALERTPLERAAAVLVSNLFGLAEPIGAVAAAARAAGCAVVDDAAQAFGAADEAGPVGGRGDLGLLSFGRGKPLCAMGGGAVFAPGVAGGTAGTAEAAEATEVARTGEAGAPSGPAGRALLGALAYDLALFGPAFRILSAIPALGIGETPFEPDIAPGPIGPGPAALLPGALAAFETRRRARTEVAHRLAARIERETRWRPLLAPPAAPAAYPRLAIVAPSAAARAAAWPALERIGCGASRFYPASLDALAPLAPHRADDGDRPGARDFAARLLTWPTHGRLDGARLDAAVRTLARADA